jgi:hypothetical protein
MVTTNPLPSAICSVVDVALVWANAKVVINSSEINRYFFIGTLFLLIKNLINIIRAFNEN